MNTEVTSPLRQIRKVFCSRCSEEMERIPRKLGDKVVELSSFGIFRFRRFFCPSCYKSRLISTKQ